jgi:hypothetical protein
MDHSIHVTCFFLVEMVQAQKLSYSIASHTLSMVDRDCVNLACPDTLNEVLRDFEVGGDFFYRLEFDFGRRSFYPGVRVFAILM